MSDWYPDKARARWTTPAVGDLIAVDHGAWRVMEIRPKPADLWTDDEREAVRTSYRPADVTPCNVVIRPARFRGDDPLLRRHDRHLAVRGGQIYTWYVYPDEHYPVCAACGDPTPCRERTAARIAAREMAVMGRYELAGICPACSEVVTARQKSLTYADNLEVPAGPPVTFHQRGRCVGAAVKYERRWVAADPGRRRPSLYCEGNVTNHNDGTYDCTALSECPGPVTAHRGYSTCRCPSCHAQPWTWGRGCRPDPRAVRNAGDTT